MYRLATMHSVKDRRTDGRTDRQATLSCQQPIIGLLLYVQYDQLKQQKTQVITVSYWDK